VAIVNGGSRSLTTFSAVQSSQGRKAISGRRCRCRAFWLIRRMGRGL